MSYKLTLTTAETRLVADAVQTIQEIVRAPDVMTEAHRLYRAEYRGTSQPQPSKAERDCRAVTWFLNGVSGLKPELLYGAPAGNVHMAIAGAYFATRGRVPANAIETLTKARTAYDNAHDRACNTSVLA